MRANGSPDLYTGARAPSRRPAARVSDWLRGGRTSEARSCSPSQVGARRHTGRRLESHGSARSGSGPVGPAPRGSRPLHGTARVPRVRVPSCDGSSRVLHLTMRTFDDVWRLMNTTRNRSARPVYKRLARPIADVRVRAKARVACALTPPARQS